jgi:diguanylate cyclase (GGDEF)-like protein
MAGFHLPLDIEGSEAPFWPRYAVRRQVIDDEAPIPARLKPDRSGPTLLSAMQLPGFAVLRFGVKAGLLAAAYFLGARYGLMFALVSGNASPVWPPAGIAVAALFLGGWRLWPGVLLGAVVVNVTNGASPLGAALAGCGAVAEALGAVAILRRARFRPQLDRLLDVPLLAVAGSALPAVVGATIGVAGLATTGSIAPDGLPLAWSGWFVGDALSILIVGGIAFTWLTPPRDDRLRDRPIEAVIALGSILAVSVVLFFDVFDLRASGQSVAFPIFPLVVWVAFRVGPRGTALAAVAFSGVAIAATEQGLGPFLGTTKESSLLYLAVFIALVAISGAAVAAVVAERDADRLALESSGQRAADALRELQALEAIGRTLAEHGPTPEALDSIVGALVEVFGYSHPSIYTGDSQHLRLGAQRGYTSTIEDVDSSTGIMARVMRTQETQFLPDVSIDPDFLRADPAVRSEIAVPLLSQGALLGILNVENRSRLDGRDLATVSVVADRVAVSLALALERAKMAELTVRDPLTGLHNRRYLDEALAQLTAARARLRGQPSPLAVIMFDLDHFGDFNNRYGHQTGDEALRVFTRILRDRFRASDIVARYGGEEFITILPGADAADAQRVAETIRAELAATKMADTAGGLMAVTVSAGCAGSADPDVTPDALIRSADVGLAMAKRAGRNRVVAA